MTLREKIDADIKQAMLQKEKETLIALRGIKSMILLAETDKNLGDITPEAENKILMKAAKQRKESAEIFAKENRADLAQKELFEYDVIARYLPAQLSAEALESEVKKIIEQAQAKSAQDAGRVIGLASKALAGRAEGKAIADAVKKLLA